MEGEDKYWILHWGKRDEKTLLYNSKIVDLCTVYVDGAKADGLSLPEVCWRRSVIWFRVPKVSSAQAQGVAWPNLSGYSSGGGAPTQARQGLVRIAEIFHFFPRSPGVASVGVSHRGFWGSRPVKKKRKRQMRAIGLITCTYIRLGINTQQSHLYGLAERRNRQPAKREGPHRGSRSIPKVLLARPE